jgi:hypothetical protein
VIIVIKINEIGGKIMSSHAIQNASIDMQQCIQNCLDCHRICLETVAYCLKMGGKHADPEHISLLLNCAEICQTSAKFMISGTDLHKLTCGVCAEVCARCADSVRMKACVEACRRCVQSCRQMAA